MTSDRNYSLGMLEMPLSRSDMIAERIRRAILEGELEPGAALVERELAGQFGVSKTPVREALISLAQSGLLTINRQRGYAVASIDEEDVTSIYEVRLLLEPYAIRQAAKEWTRDDSGPVAQLLDDAEKAGLESRWSDLSMLNRRFHHDLYSRGAGKLVVSILDNVQDRIALMGVESWKQRPTWEREGEEHRAILEAVERNDAEHASTLAHAHVSAFADLIKRIRSAKDLSVSQG